MQMRVVVETTKQDEDGNDIGSPKRKAYVLSSEEPLDFQDAKDWFEETFPVDGVDDDGKSEAVGYKPTRTGFVKYTMRVGG